MGSSIVEGTHTVYRQLVAFTEPVADLNEEAATAETSAKEQHRAPGIFLVDILLIFSLSLSHRWMRATGLGQQSEHIHQVKGVLRKYISPLSTQHV
jgi:hypothetical protein